MTTPSATSVPAGKRHQLAIVAGPVDDLVAEQVLALLSVPANREALLVGFEVADDGTIVLAELGSAQSRLQCLDDDFYVSGLLAEGRFRSIRAKLEREIDRLHASADAITKRRLVMHPDPRLF